jgi:hypothetical protein
VPLWVVGDRGYSSHELRERVWSAGARPAIPTRSNEAPVACPAWIYNNRNIVERRIHPAGLSITHKSRRDG